MKNVLLGGIALLLIVTAGLVVFAGDEPATDMMSLPNTTTADATKQPTLTENSTQLAMGYQDYTEAAFQESTDKRILFFHASWCPSCRFYEKDILASGVPEGVTVFKTDYDTSDALKEQYGVNVQSTFVLVDADGNEIKSWPYAAGISSAADLFNQVASL